MNNFKIKQNDNLVGLDFLRFFLSISVIIWHYQHFFYPNQVKREIYLTQQPFFKFLSLFYQHGEKAVPVFWIISGFVFYKFYSTAIENRQVNFKKFLINRLTRLYPLHFLMLFVVLILQAIYFHFFNSYFVYDNNSIKYFILNLFFVQNWATSPKTLGSFNGPEWSVSIEIFIYLVFFLVCFLKLINNYRLIILLIVISLVLETLSLGLVNFNECFYFFFSGCLLAKVIENSNKHIFVVLICFVAYFILHFSLKSFFKQNGEVHSILLMLTNVHYAIQQLFFSICTVYLIIIIFRYKIFHKISAKFYSAIGNLTYSMYLIHFPIQIIMFLTLKSFSYTIFYSPAVFAVFMLLTLSIGYLSFNYFERPLQVKLRTYFEKK